MRTSARRASIAVLGSFLLVAVGASAGPVRLSDLPIAAQAQVSATLGGDQPRYHAAPHAGGFRLENAAHGLEADFDRAGVHIRAGTVRWGLSLLGYGYSNAPGAATSVAPHAAANRVEYRRGALTEWYLNGPLGLEQGFTLERAPGRRLGAPLTLSIALSGNLVASADATGKGATLSRPDGTAALRYRGLVANDATGRELPSWLEVDGAQLLLRVDDLGARYPVVIDPFIEEARLFAADGAANDLFGVSVALDGDTLVVGANADDVDGKVDQGSAYVFVKPAGGWSGPLTQQARLIASDGAAGDAFGGRLALEGDTVVVGAPGDRPAFGGVNLIRGAAYLFVKPDSGWSGTLTQQAKLTASDGAPNDRFGDSVGISGDVLVVGSSWDDFFRGSAYVFVKPAGGWAGSLTQRARLIASDRTEGSGIGDAFGAASAIQGDTIVVGALGKDRSPGLLVDSGAAYVFVKPPAGWTGLLVQNAKLVASDGATNDRFGAAVTVDGDTVVAGSPLDDTTVISDHGSAYVYEKPAAGWSGTRTENAKLIPSDPVANAQLGTSAVLDGEVAVVGALAATGATVPGAGAAYLYEKPATGWSGTLNQTEKLTASDGATGDQFGAGVAMRGDIIVVGARADDVGAAVNQGSAYVFSKELRSAALGLSPESDENPVGTSHTLTATATTASGQAVPNVTVRFDVTGAVTTSGTCVTGPTGACDFTYPGPTTPGSDTIVAFADTSGDGVNDPDEPEDTAEKTWILGAPDSVLLTPATAENPVGTSHTVMAAIADSFANPSPGVTVRFVVTGAVNTLGQCVTAANGSCTFAYAGPTAPGSDAILAFADTNGNGGQDPGEPAGAAAKTWVPGAPHTVTVTPEAATNPVGTEHCVDAVVVDSFGNAVPGVVVRFTVAGAVDTAGTDVTDPAGRASFCYMGPELPGADAITAHADTNGDGAVDAGEPVNGATKSWLLPESTPGQSSGGGHVAGSHGEIAFGFNAKNHQGALNGKCNVVDRGAGVHVKCLGVTSLVVTGTHAAIFGAATVNGVGTTYRIDVEDLAEPGEGEDVFIIVTQSGYEAGGALVRGNIQVR